MNVELHIERLVPERPAPSAGAGRAALAGAFGRELTRLIQDGGDPAGACSAGPATHADPPRSRSGSRLGPRRRRSVYWPAVVRELGRV